MNTKISSLLRQITLDEQLYHAIKCFCTRNNQTLTMFYRDVLDWFFAKDLQTENLIFQASLKRGKRLSLWIESRQIQLIKTLAVRFRVSDARVIYTALMLYLDECWCD